jgi:hypothetical protein
MKKHIHTLLLALSLPLASLAQSAPEAPGKPSPSPGLPPDPARVPNPNEIQPSRPADSSKLPAAVPAKRVFAGTITTLSRDTKVITIEDAKLGTQKLHIAETTKLLHGDMAATWEDLKVGQKVEGTCHGTPELSHAEILTIKD